MKKSIYRQLGLALSLPLLLAACQKQMEVPKVSASVSPNGSTGSVAKPALVPPSDASIKPVVPDEAAPAGQASAAGDLSRQQESSAMPMAGQVNDHSPTTIYKKK